MENRKSIIDPKYRRRYLSPIVKANKSRQVEPNENQTAKKKEINNRIDMKYSFEKEKRLGFAVLVLIN